MNVVPSAESRVQSAAARKTNRTAFWLSLAAGVLLWASFPPVNWWPLAWVAPVPWLVLARVPQPFTWRTYTWIYLGGFVHWLAMLEGIRLAHPALVMGWLTLAWYLAFYTPILVWLCRVATQRLRVPLVLAAPVIWVGLELVRGHFATGFAAGLLGHTQITWTSLLQIADVFGTYGVSFVLAIVAAAIAQMMPARWIGVADADDRPVKFWPAIPAAVFLVATLAYGSYRLSETPPGANQPPLYVALIQGSLDTVFEASEDEERKRFEHYGALTDQAVQRSSELDLIIWPESMFAIPEVLVTTNPKPPAGINLSPELFHERLTILETRFEREVQGWTARINGSPQPDSGGTYFLFGTNTYQYGPHPPKIFNSALLADPHGKIVGRYYKVHPVMFGEYIPFGEWFPWIYDLTPMPRGLDRGPGPTAMEVAGKRLSPCICFENVLPHLIRRQVVELDRRGTPPDILVTVTNDGWFYGSSILDLHFRCAVFRAIENRRPMLIAANTGISAHIDGSGRVVEVGPRREPKVLLASVRPDGRHPLYFTLGDWPAIGCAALCGLIAVSGLWQKRRSEGGTKE